MGRMTLITGGERRRRWSDEDRVRILAAIEEPGAMVAEVARREDVCTRCGNGSINMRQGNILNELYKLILDLTDGVSWPLSLQAAWLSSPA